MGLRNPNSEGTDERLPFLDFYRRYFPELKEEDVLSDGNIAIMCPDYFHVPRLGKSQTETPSYYVNVITGAGYCHACKVTHTDAAGFLMEKDGVTYPEALKAIEEDPEPIPESHIDKLHNNLVVQPKILDFLRLVKRIEEETVRRYKLGFDGERICTPIRNDKGEVVNLRRYLKGATKKQGKVISYRAGYGKTRIFPIENLLTRGSKRLVMMGGEFKAIASDQESKRVAEDKQWAAITTAGEGTMPRYLLKWFAEEVKKGDPVLYLCMDIDEAGNTAAQRYANKLAPLGIECRIVRLPIASPPNGDFNDYLAQGGTAEEFLRLLDEAEMLHVEQVAEDDEAGKEVIIHPAHLSETSQGHLAGKHVQTEVVVAGKDLSPYILPKCVNLRCKQEWGDKCEGCGLQAFNGSRELRFESTDKTLLNLVGVTDKEVSQKIREKARITPKCPYLRMENSEQMNIEEVLLIPELDFSAENREYVTRRGYYVGNGMRANRAYSLQAVSLPDPRTQHATLLIYNAEDGKTNLNNFRMNEELYEKLKIFQGSPGDVIQKVARDLSHNVTRIYGRDEVAIATDLVFHSALQFNFDGKLIRKGCLEGLFFGDTRTGKSETVQNIHKHYRLGEFMDCGNTTFAGLVGGMQQTGNKRWQVTWGKIPLNNGGLVTLDEVSSLSMEAIGDMTGIRSSGVAEIVKIQTERTQAMVRMIWISNPRQLNMTLSKYNYGINGVQELIGRPEDVARFDFVLAVAFNDKLDELINTSKHEEVEHVYTSDLCHSLILWAWTRKPEQITFTEEAEQACLSYASKMGHDFTPQFPIVISADQRIKIARLAVAIAIRTFSTPDGERVVVDKSHVEFAVEFLYRIYDDSALGYRDYSKQLNFTRDKAQKNMVTILKWMRTHKNVCETILEMPIQFKALDLMDMLALDKDDARAILSLLKQNGLIGPAGGAAYKKEGHFIDMLRNPQKYCAEHNLDWDVSDEGPGLGRNF